MDPFLKMIQDEDTNAIILGLFVLFKFLLHYYLWVCVLFAGENQNNGCQKIQ